MSGSTVSYVGVGTCTLMAHVAAGTNYTAADGSNQDVSIAQATPTTPTITNLPASGITGDTYIAVVNTSGDGTTSVTSSTPGVCTATGLTVTFNSSGSCAVTPLVGTGTNFTSANGSPANITVYDLPATPGAVVAIAGVNSAQVSWSQPTGGATVTGFTVTATPGGVSTSVAAGSSTGTVAGLQPGIAYTFTVTALSAGPSVVSAASNAVVPTSVAPDSSASSAGTDPSATTNSGATTVTASATGSGTVTVSTYPSNPVAAFAAGSAYFDVAISAGSTFTAVSFKVCGLSTGQGVSWWNPAAQAWQTVSNFTAVGSDGCSTVTVGATTSPNLTQMGGTVFASTSAGMNGYWLVASDGGVFAYGDAAFYGSMGGKSLNKPIVGMTATADGLGYWLVASDGGVFAYGDAAFYGSTGGKTLNKPIVGMTATADGLGYWLVASDGGVFAYGDAAFYGSTGGKTLNKPIVCMTATPDGKGYWLVAADGGIFAYGDAVFYGSTGGKTLNKPIVCMSTTADGLGYWLVASDGGIFAYGDAVFYGSMGGKTLNKPIVHMAATPDGLGYWLVAADGGVFSYGDATFYGSTGGTTLNKPIVAIAN